MGTVLQQSGFSFKINTDDHEPAHVHIWHQGNVLIVNFLNEIVIRDNFGFNRNEARRAVRIVQEKQKFLLEKWREIHLMNEKTFDRQFAAATKRSNQTLATAPLAEKVSFDANARRLIIDLQNKVTFIVPVGLIQILEKASDDQISDVEIKARGLFLSWNQLDEDLSIEKLISGIFGTKKWMNNLREHLSNAGKKGGSAQSEAKKAASAANGRKGGRPKKTA